MCKPKPLVSKKYLCKLSCQVLTLPSLLPREEHQGMKSKQWPLLSELLYLLRLLVKQTCAEMVLIIVPICWILTWFKNLCCYKLECFLNMIMLCVCLCQHLYNHLAIPNNFWIHWAISAKINRGRVVAKTLSSYQFCGKNALMLPMEVQR